MIVSSRRNAKHFKFNIKHFLGFALSNYGEKKKCNRLISYRVGEENKRDTIGTFELKIDKKNLIR